MTLKIDKQHCDAHSEQLREFNDCTVYACAITTQTDYPTMHEYLAKECGRVRGKGLPPYKYQSALRALGYDLIELRGPSLSWVEHWVEGHYKYDRWGRSTWVNGHDRRKLVKVDDDGDYNARTVGVLRKELKKGIYLVGTKAHVLALVDGVVYDYRQGRNADRRIVRDVIEVRPGTGQYIRRRLRA